MCAEFEMISSTHFENTAFWDNNSENVTLCTRAKLKVKIFAREYFFIFSTDVKIPKMFCSTKSAEWLSRYCQKTEKNHDKLFLADLNLAKPFAHCANDSFLLKYIKFQMFYKIKL